MAGKSKVKSDLAAHEQTYNGFIKLLVYGIYTTAIVTVVVLMLIS